MSCILYQLHELQEAFMQTTRDLKGTKARLQGVKNERRRTQLTVTEVQRAAPDTHLFRSIGKSFPPLFSHLLIQC